MPTMQYYFMNHPDALQHGITPAEAIVMVVTIAVLALVVYAAVRL